MDGTEVKRLVTQMDTTSELVSTGSFQHAKPIEEMLGSVTTYNNLEVLDALGNVKSCQQLRTSARVFKKMKLDSAQAVTTAPLPDKEKKDSPTEVTKLEVKKPLRPQWTPEDKDIFFEALNEYGKDFDAIQQHINNKFKKKGLPDTLIKTKDQVRHFYYRTWHKVSKHLKFSDDIKKIAQELYALINYGELRKKVGSVSEKTCLKLNELIYRGTVTIRIKGRSIRIKTPMCRALRKLNQLDEKHEDLKLPSRVLVELRPKDMETWLKVQFMSQNPRLRFTLPLQRRISALLSFVNERWKNQITRTHEKVHSFTSTSPTECGSCNGTSGECPLRFAPKSTCTIEIPTINISEYLTSHRICLNAYEERVGVKNPGKQLWQTMCSSFKGGGRGAAKKHGAKRQRNESTGEKSTIKQKDSCDEPECDNQKTTNHVDTAINTILSLQVSEQNPEQEANKSEIKTELPSTEASSSTTEPISDYSEEKERIRQGWTIDTCGTLTIGELYLMFGNDSKLELEYSWDMVETPSKPCTSETVSNEDIPSEETPDIKQPNQVSKTLQKLLSLARLHYRKERIRCHCGHICGLTPKTTTAHRNKSIATKTNQRTTCEPQEKNIPAKASLDNATRPVVTNSASIKNPPMKSEPMFRKPVYPSNGAGMDSFRAQLDSLQRMRPKYTNRKGRPVRAKHVVVERVLPLLPKPPTNGHSLVTMKVISQTDGMSKLRPIAPKIEELAEETKTADRENESEGETSSFFGSNETTIIENTDLQIPPTETDQNVIEPVAEMMETSSLTSYSAFLNLEIPQTDTTDFILPSPTDNSSRENLTSFAGLLSDDLPSSTPLSSPSRILKENDNQWLNSEVNDYSLTSLLGHLESPMKPEAPVILSDDTSISPDIDDSQFRSLLSENGVDFVDQFVDMAANVHTDTNEIEEVTNT